jgi:hypothetical protein
MSARVLGSVAASFSRMARLPRSIATLPGGIAWRNASDGPSTSDYVIGGPSAPPWVKRSPQSSVRVVDSLR